MGDRVLVAGATHLEVQLRASLYRVRREQREAK
jgi:hypothetical protein